MFLISSMWCLLGVGAPYFFYVVSIRVGVPYFFYVVCVVVAACIWPCKLND